MAESHGRQLLSPSQTIPTSRALLRSARPAAADYDPDDPDLEEARRKNEARFSKALGSIFSKYGKDFDGVGDEIDLVTGEVIVNNGHLHRMQHEQDSGLLDGVQRRLLSSIDAGANGDDDIAYERDSDDDCSVEDEEDEYIHQQLRREFLTPHSPFRGHARANLREYGDGDSEEDPLASDDYPSSMVMQRYPRNHDARSLAQQSDQPRGTHAPPSFADPSHFQAFKPNMLPDQLEMYADFSADINKRISRFVQQLVNKSIAPIPQAPQLFQNNLYIGDHQRHRIQIGPNTVKSSASRRTLQAPARTALLEQSHPVPNQSRGLVRRLPLDLPESPVSKRRRLGTPGQPSLWAGGRSRVSLPAPAGPYKPSHAKSDDRRRSHEEAGFRGELLLPPDPEGSTSSGHKHKSGAGTDFTHQDYDQDHQLSTPDDAEAVSDLDFSARRQINTAKDGKLESELGPELLAVALQQTPKGSTDSIRKPPLQSISDTDDGADLQFSAVNPGNSDNNPWHERQPKVEEVGNPTTRRNKVPLVIIYTKKDRRMIQRNEHVTASDNAIDWQPTPEPDTVDPKNTPRSAEQVPEQPIEEPLVDISADEKYVSIEQQAKPGNQTAMNNTVLFPYERPRASIYITPNSTSTPQHDPIADVTLLNPTASSLPQETAAKQNLVSDATTLTSRTRLGRVSARKWTSGDDALIKKLVEEDGASWNDVIARFPGSSKGQIQYRYYRFLRPDHREQLFPSWVGTIREVKRGKCYKASKRRIQSFAELGATSYTTAQHPDSFERNDRSQLSNESREFCGPSEDGGIAIAGVADDVAEVVECTTSGYAPSRSNIADTGNHSEEAAGAFEQPFVSEEPDEGQHSGLRYRGHIAESTNGATESLGKHSATPNDPTSNQGSVHRSNTTEPTYIRSPRTPERQQVPIEEDSDSDATIPASIGRAFFVSTIESTQTEPVPTDTTWDLPQSSREKSEAAVAMEASGGAGLAYSRSDNGFLEKQGCDTCGKLVSSDIPSENGRHLCSGCEMPEQKYPTPAPPKRRRRRRARQSAAEELGGTKSKTVESAAIIRLSSLGGESSAGEYSDSSDELSWPSAKRKLGRLRNSAAEKRAAPDSRAAAQVTTVQLSSLGRYSPASTPSGSRKHTPRTPGIAVGGSFLASSSNRKSLKGSARRPTPPPKGAASLLDEDVDF